MNPDLESRDGGAPAEEDVREFRLEGLGLVLVGAVLLAALSGAFYLGRWYESRQPEAGRDRAVAELPGADASTRSKVVSAEDDLTAFDTVDDGVVLEPGREARPPASTGTAGAPAGASTDAAAATPDRATPVAPPVGPWTVQVAAVRDRRSAETLFGELRDGGFDARIDAVRDGSDTVFKVRVGSFADRDAAAPTAKKLEDGGHSAWVTRAD